MGQPWRVVEDITVSDILSAIAERDPVRWPNDSMAGWTSPIPCRLSLHSQNLGLRAWIGFNPLNHIRA